MRGRTQEDDDTLLVRQTEKVRHIQVSLPQSWWRRLEALKPRGKSAGFSINASLAKAIMKAIARMEEELAPDEDAVISLNGNGGNEHA